jgi:recombination protein RecA
MSQALRKLAAAINKSKTCMIFINQIRMKIGVMFGNPETTTGGNALKFYASIRLDIRRMESLKNEDGVYGSRTKVKVVKNKLAPPFKEAQFEIIYGKGISRAAELIDLATTANIIEKSGTWYSYRDERIGQGRDNARKYLEDNPPVAEKIEKEIKEHLGLSGKEKKGEPKEGGKGEH